jgi:hypothetical protein
VGVCVGVGVGVGRCIDCLHGTRMAACHTKRVTCVTNLCHELVPHEARLSVRFRVLGSGLRA